MRIRRIVLKDPFNRDDELVVDGDDDIASSVCFRGVNGSGKTTCLLAIARLWEAFRDLARPSAEPAHIEPLLMRVRQRLLAMHVSDLPGPVPAIWLVEGSRRLWNEVERRDADPVVGALGDVGKRSNAVSPAGCAKTMRSRRNRYSVSVISRPDVSATASRPSAGRLPI